EPEPAVAAAPTAAASRPAARARAEQRTGAAGLPAPALGFGRQVERGDLGRCRVVEETGAALQHAGGVTRLGPVQDDAVVPASPIIPITGRVDAGRVQRPDRGGSAQEALG